MRYMVARFDYEQEKTLYEIYVSDALKLIAENTAKRVNGSFPSVRYIDLIDRAPKDERTGDEIASDVIQRCGLVVI